MKKLFFATAIILSACNENRSFSSSYEEKNDVTLRTLNSKNDLQVCYDPINCLFVPESLQKPSLDFLNAQHEVAVNSRAPASVAPAATGTPYDKFSPLVAEKIENLKSLIKKPLTLTAASRSPNSKPAGITGVDFHVEGMSSDELKTYCEQANANSITVYNSYIHCDWLAQPLSKDGLAKDVALKVDGELKKGESVTLSVDAFDKDANSEMFVEWEVRFAGRKVNTHNAASTLTLKDLKHGMYQVQAHVGGRMAESFSLIVE